MPVDLYATKGTEYLLVIAYLLLMAGIVTLFTSRRFAGGRVPQAAAAPRRAVPWFALADGYHFHPGHAWAAESDGDMLTVGLDDFAAQLVGTPDAVTLPAVGASVRQGEPGWTLAMGDRALAMLSPVEGEVVAVNPAVLERPRLATDDPYGSGWLFRVRAPRRGASLRNLLSGELAAVWMRHTVERLRRMPFAELGVVSPDGGSPVRGFGRDLGAAEWDVVTREFFITG